MRGLAVVVAVTATIGISLAPHASAGEVTTTAVNGTFRDLGFLTGFEGASPSPPAVPSEGVFRGTSEVDGRTMHGTVSYTLWGSPNSEGYFDFHSVEVFTGFVAECGRGTMTYTVVGTAKPYGLSDPTHSHLHATWLVVADSGTNGLAGVVSGGGELDGKTGPSVNSPDPTTNSGTITGAVHCEQRR